MKKLNSTELKRKSQLTLLFASKNISDLEEQISFKLHNKSGTYIADYTPDFIYKIGNKKIAEEIKGSAFMRSATRQDYLLRVKWFLSEYDYLFYELIDSKKGFVINQYVLQINKNGKVYLKKINI